MARVKVAEMLPSEVAASVEVRRLLDARDLQEWLDADLPERLVLVAREGGRVVGVLLGGARGEACCVTAFALHPMVGAPVAVAFLLISALARHLGPVAFEQCAFALRRADLDVRQAISAFGARSEAPTYLFEAVARAPKLMALS